MKTYSGILRTDLDNLRKLLKRRKKYPHNSTYKENERLTKFEIDKDSKMMLKFLESNYKEQFSEEKEQFKNLIKELLEKNNFEERLEKIDSVLTLLNKLDIDVGPFRVETSFEIPNIPDIEVQLDVKEARNDLEANTFISSLVMSRRAYEGALVELFRKIEKKDPTEPKCATCGRGGYMGIVKLHKWAIAKGFVNEKLKSLGYLISDLGAGGAHPPLQEFPRNKEIARAILAALIAVLKDIYE